MAEQSSSEDAQLRAELAAAYQARNKAIAEAEKIYREAIEASAKAYTEAGDTCEVAVVEAYKRFHARQEALPLPDLWG